MIKNNVVNKIVKIDLYRNEIGENIGYENDMVDYSYNILDSYYKNSIVEYEYIVVDNKSNTVINELNNFVKKNIGCSKHNSLHDMDESDVTNYLYYCCLLGLTEIVDEILKLNPMYDLELLLRLAFTNSYPLFIRKHVYTIIECLDKNGIDINYNDYYVIYLLNESNYDTLLKYIKKNPEIQIVDYLFKIKNMYNCIYDDYYKFMKYLHKSNLLSNISEFDVLCISCHNSELLKYFFNNGYDYSQYQEIIDMTSEHIDGHLSPNFFNLDYFDDIFPPHILLYKYIYNNDFESIQLLLDGGKISCDIIRDIIYSGFNLSDDIWKLCLEHFIINNGILEISTFLKIIDRQLFDSELLQKYFIKNMTKILSSLDLVNEYVDTNNKLFNYVKTLDIDQYFNILYNVFPYIFKYCNDIEFIKTIMTYIDIDSDYAKKLCSVTHNDYHICYYSYIEKLKLLPDELFYENYNDMLAAIINNTNKKVVQYFIDKYINNHVITLDLIKLLVKKNNMREFVMMILNNQYFNKSELDSILNCCYHDFEIYNYLVDLGANINNSNSILDIIIVANYHKSDDKFKNYYINGDIDVIESIKHKIDEHDKNLCIVINNSQFRENVKLLLEIDDLFYYQSEDN